MAYSSHRLRVRFRKKIKDVGKIYKSLKNDKWRHLAFLVSKELMTSRLRRTAFILAPDLLCCDLAQGISW
jgi:uncharacterized protein YaaW (UPF0174 family)